MKQDDAKPKTPFNSRACALNPGARLSGKVVDFSPALGAFVDCELGRDVLVHKADVWRIATERKPQIGQRVDGRISVFLPKEGRIGLLPDYPGHQEPFPLGLMLEGTCSNADALRQFVQINASVDAVFDRADRAADWAGRRVRVRIFEVDWDYDPTKPRVRVELCGDPDATALAVTGQPARSGSRSTGQMTVVIDASNVISERRTGLTLEALDEIASFLRQRRPGVRILEVFDRSTLDQLSGETASLIFARQAAGNAIVSFDGVDADVFVLAAARRLGALVVTNDHYADWPNERIGVPLVRFDASGADRVGLRHVDTHEAESRSTRESLESALDRSNKS